MNCCNRSGSGYFCFTWSPRSAFALAVQPLDGNLWYNQQTTTMMISTMTTATTTTMNSHDPSQRDNCGDGDANEAGDKDRTTTMNTINLAIATMTMVQKMTVMMLAVASATMMCRDSQR